MMDFRSAPHPTGVPPVPPVPNMGYAAAAAAAAAAAGIPAMMMPPPPPSPFGMYAAPNPPGMYVNLGKIHSYSKEELIRK